VGFDMGRVLPKYGVAFPFWLKFVNGNQRYTWWSACVCGAISHV